MHCTINEKVLIKGHKNFLITHSHLKPIFFRPMKIINYFLATAALLYAASATAQQYVSPAGNVALGKNAVSSTGTAELAFDNNEGTRWESSQIDGQWIYVDLEADYALDQLQLVWEGAYAKHYKIFVASELTAEMTDELADDDTANDFSNTGWTLAAEVNEQLEGFPYTYNVDLNAGSHGRYVALQTIERGTPYGTSLYEFRVKSFGEYIADGADEISNIFVTVAPTEIYATETATLSTAAINGKNFRVGDAEINYTSSPEGLMFEGNTVSGTTAGTYTITAASGEISASCELTILDTPTLAGLVIDVDNEQGSTAETYAFTVTATNQFGDPYTEEFEKEWIVEGSWDGNNLTVTSRGKYSVQLKSGDITSNTVTIDVLADGQNLALNKTVASSTEGSTNPQNAIDGNEGTQWEYAEPADAVDHTYDAEIIIDLGDNYDINCIHAVWEGASAADYTVTFSTDNSQWTEPTPAFTVTGGVGMINPRHDWLTQEESINARYVKLHSTKAATQYGIKLKELEVYSNGELAPAQLKAIAITADNTGAFIGDDTSGINFTLSLIDQYGTAYTLSPEESAEAQWVLSGGTMSETNQFSAEAAGRYTVKYAVGELESNEIAITYAYAGQNIVAIDGTVISSTEGSTNQEAAIDGNEGTQWEMPQPQEAVNNGDGTYTYDAEIVVDLGAAYDINCLRILWEGAAAADYTATFSTDNSTWSEPTDGFTLTGGTGMATRYDWLSQSETVNAQYVKIHATKAATGYGMKIKEIEAYSFDDLAGTLNEIKVSAEKSVGHANDEYPLTVQLLNIFGNEFVPAEESAESASWVADGGEITDGTFRATEKGSYEIYYKFGETVSNTVTIEIVASGENIVPAWGRIISQTDGATRSAENAIDGNTGTDWFITGANGAQEFEAEFVYHFNLQVGNAAKVDALHFNFEGANSCKYDVYYSLTGEDDDWTLWASFEEEPNVAARQDWLYRDELVEMNYVKFVSHKVANGEYGLRLFEMEAYGEDNDLSSGVETISAGTGSIYMAGDKIILPAVMDEVLVYNISGTLAATAENTDRINASTLADGIYIVKTTDADGNTITAKVIK